MNPAVHRGLVSVGLLMVLLTPLDPAAGQEHAAKPALSEALRSALEEAPPDSVERRFTAALQNGSPAYEADMPKLNALGMQYMQAGEMEKGRVVMAVTALAARALVAEMMPEVARAAEAAEREKRERPRRPSEEELARDRARAALGPGRADLERFHGLYRAAGDPPERSLFLVRTCDGHLLFGTTWADVAPWALRSLDDARFEWPGDEHNRAFRVHITTDASGNAIRLEHDSELVPGPLTRSGDLPAEFLPACAAGRSP